MNYQRSSGPVIRLKALCQMVGLSKSTIYLMMQTDDFPKPIKLSKRSVGWLVSEVEDWIASKTQTSGKDVV